MENPLYLSSVTHEGRVYEFHSPVKVESSYANGGTILDLQECCVLGWGPTEAEALVDFSENFDFMYRDWVEERVTDISEKAMEVKERMTALVKSVKCPCSCDGAC